MGYLAKNHTEGPDKFVVGGELAITGTGKVTVNGTQVTLGTQAAGQADSTATDAAGLVTDFNALLAKLRAAGLIAGS